VRGSNSLDNPYTLSIWLGKQLVEDWENREASFFVNAQVSVQGSLDDSVEKSGPEAHF
jgi:hypothetical protein